MRYTSVFAALSALAGVCSATQIHPYKGNGAAAQPGLPANKGFQIGRAQEVCLEERAMCDASRGPRCCKGNSEPLVCVENTCTPLSSVQKDDSPADGCLKEGAACQIMKGPTCCKKNNKHMRCIGSTCVDTPNEVPTGPADEKADE